MPRFLGELPTWPEVEEELKKRQADPATIATVRTKYWADYAGTEEIKALPPIHVEATRSRFFQQPVTPTEPSLTLMEKVAPFFSSDKLPQITIPSGPSPAAPPGTARGEVAAPPITPPLAATHQPPLPGPMNIAQAIVAPMTGRTMADLDQRPLVVPSHVPVRPETTIGPAAGPLPPILPPVERRAPAPQTAGEQAGAFVKGFGVGYEKGAADYQNELRDLTVGLAHRAGVISKEPPRAEAPDTSGVPAGLAGSTGMTLGSLPATFLSIFETAGIGRAEKAGRAAAKLIPRIVKSAADFAARFGTKTAVETVGAGGTPKEVAKRGGISAAGAAVFGAAGPAAAETAATAGRMIGKKLVESGVAVETAALVASAVERVVHGTIAATPIYPMAKAQGASDEQAVTETLAWILFGAHKSGAGEWAAKRTDAVNRGAAVFERGGIPPAEAKTSAETIVDLAHSGNTRGAEAALRAVSREAAKTLQELPERPGLAPEVPPQAPQGPAPKPPAPPAAKVAAKPVPQPEIMPETHDATPDTSRPGFVPGDDTGIGPPPGTRWETDPGAMPGEPYFALDIPKDGGVDDGKAFITEREIEGKGAVWEAWLSDGRGGQFTNVEDAAKWAEEQTDASAIRTRQGQRVPEAAQEGPQAQGGAQEGQGDRGADLEQAPPRGPEPVVEGGKGPVQEVAPIDYRSPAVQKEDAKADRELERRGKAWFLDVDDKPVYTDRKTATDQGMRGPFTKQYVSEAVGVSPEELKTAPVEKVGTPPEVPTVPPARVILKTARHLGPVEVIDDSNPDTVQVRLPSGSRVTIPRKNTQPTTEVPGAPGIVVKSLVTGQGERLPVEKGWTEIGKNEIGQTLYEDHRGVRSYIENGVRITEPVAMVPTRQGTIVRPKRSGNVFKLTGELEPTEKPAAQAGFTFEAIGVPGGVVVGGERAKRPDGRLIPRDGDEVYFDMGGGTGVVGGRVYQSKNGKLRVKITGGRSLFGGGYAGPKAVDLDTQWTVVGDPRPEELRQEKLAEDTTRIKDEQEKYQAKLNTDRATAIKAIETGRHASLRTAYQRGLLEPGAIVYDHSTNLAGEITDVEKSGSKAPNPQVFVRWSNEPPGTAGGFIGDLDRGVVTLVTPDAAPITPATTEQPPEHVVRALQKPWRVVSDSVITKTKEQAKETLREAIANGTVTRDTPVRLTDTRELHNLATSGELTEEKSAQIVVGENGEALPIMGYGHGISAAVIMPEGYSRRITGTEEGQPNEVKIDPKAPVEEMRFIVDGYKRLLTYAELVELIETGKLAALEQAAALRGEKPEVILKGGEGYPGEPETTAPAAPPLAGGEPGGLHPAAGELGVRGSGPAVGAERPTVPAAPAPRAEEVTPTETPTAKLTVRKGNGRHPYTATMKGKGVYGFGNTPDEARAKFWELKKRFDEERVARVTAKEVTPPVERRKIEQKTEKGRTEVRIDYQDPKTGDFLGGVSNLPSFFGGVRQEISVTLSRYKEDVPGLERALGDDFMRYLTEQGLAKVPVSAATAPTPAADAARRVAEELVTLTELTPRKLKEIGDAAWGGTQAQGTYTSKDLSDAMELGVNLYLRQQEEGKADPTVPTAQGAAKRIALLEHLTDLLPTQTRRTDEMVTHQQFSTPPAYAYLINWLANIRPEDTVLEPSAGNGAIAVFAMNANPKEVVANEIAPRRADNLRTLGIGRVFTEDAEQLNNALPGDVRPTVVVMNPPFSQTAGRMGDKREIMTGARHIEAALKRLVPGGRLVAIAGRGMTMDAPTYRAWWTRIQKEYNVRANVGAPANVYAKYGTAFATRILVIDKTGPTTGIVQVGNLDTLQQGTDLLSEVRNDRRSPNLEQKPIEPGGGPLPQEGGGAPGIALPFEPTAGDLGVGEPKHPAGVGIQVPGGTPRAGKPHVELAAGEGGGPPGEPGLGPIAGESGAGNLPADRGVGLGTGGGLPHPEPPQQPEQVAGTVEVADQGTARKSGALDENVIFEPYTPQRLSIPGAQPHPGALVESAAMASVLPPKPTYSPNLPKEVISKGLLSLSQLEAVVYAGQAHEEMLPASEGETPYRRGFMIGDGTGVGKGREIAGIIMDNMRRGRKKALWITEKRILVDDARRDWTAIGGDSKLIMDYGKIKAGSEIASTHGIMVATYDTLKSGSEFAGIPKKKKAPTEEGQAPEKQKASRLDQLVRWVGEDFDGVLVFDETHNMGNAIEIKGVRGKKQPAAKALAGVELQRRLPNARVVYSSATAATEVSNLSYADRLGLWGRGTAFATKHKFIADIGAGRLAAMEMVALNSKAMGAYVARSLSFNDGTPEGTVEVGRITHQLTEGQREIYNELAEAWQVVLQNFEKALEIVAGAENRRGEIKVSKEARKNAMSQFWGTQQRFFNQVLTAMQMPSIIADMETELEAGHSCVVQIINTNEAEQERQIAKAESPEDLEELDLTPREALMQMVQHAFPVFQQEQYTDDNGNVGWRLVVDSKGNPVENSEAVEMRDRLLDHLASIRVPDGPLEHLFNHFGVDNVAEVTGRTRRIVRKTMPDGGQKTVVERRSSHANAAETDAFQEGNKRILVFSAAGGTGRSYHSDRTAKNQQRRVHYLAQPGWRADTAVQGLGRTHRTNQVSAPIVKLTETDIKGHKRFISSIARRLDQQGALTKGQRQAGSGGIFSAADNLESAEARDALETLLTDIHRGDVEGITNAEFESSTGLKLTTEDGNLKEQLPSITQFLNRLLALKVDAQNSLFDAFAERLQQKVDQAIASGTLDQGMETVKADSIAKKDEQIVYTDPRSGAETKYIKLEVKNKTKVTTWEAVNRGTGLGGKKPEFFVRSSHGKVYAAADGGTKTRPDGYVMRQYRLADQRSFHYVDTDSIDYDYKKRYTKIDDLAEAERQWNEAVAELPQFTSEDRHLLTGALLPVWDRLPTSMTKVQRMVTDEGERFLGRVIPPGQIGAVLERLGAGAPESEIKITPTEAMNKIADGRITVKLSNGWTVKRAIVGGEPRVEIVGPDFQTDNELKRDGVFTERIAYAKRYFIPTGAQGPETFRRITEYRPVAEVVHRSQVETPAPKAKHVAPASDEEMAKALSERMLNQRRGTPEKGTPKRPPEERPLRAAKRGHRWHRITKGDPKSRTIEWVEGIPADIPGITGVDIFAYQNEDGLWKISEATTGMALGGEAKSYALAIDETKRYLARLNVDNDKFHATLAKSPKLPSLDIEGEPPEELHAASGPWAAILESLFGTRSRPDSVAVESKFPEVEKRWRAAKGLPSAGLIMKVRKAVVELRLAWQGSIPGINPHESPEMAVAQDILRQYNAVPSLAKAVAHDILWNVTRDLGPKREDLLTRVLALRDIVRNVESGIDTEDSTLSFGYENADEAREDLAKYEAVLALPENSPVHAALERAIAQRQAIVQKLVDLELLPEEALNNAGAYYHRQVLSHYQPEKTKFVGTGSGDVRLHKKGFQKRRVGGEHDFNTRYTEAEFEWLSQAVAQIATKETLDKLDRALNIADRLRQEARTHNNIELFGGFDNYQRVQYLRSIPRDERSDEQIVELRELDVLAPFRQRIAIAMSQLRGMIEEGQVEVPERYSKVADQLAAEGDTDGLWPFLSWLAEQSDSPGSGPARGVFKAISDREAFIRQRLGDNYLTWGYQGQRIDQRIKPEGYSFWQPEKGNHFFGALTIPEKVLARVLEGTNSLSVEDLKRVLVIGGVKRQWVIPTSLAKALDSYRDHDESPVERAAVAAQSSWKQWTLLNPGKALRYNFNNQSGDMDISIAIDPGIVTHEYLKAARDLWNYQVTHRVSAALREEMQEAIKRGVIESGLTVAEIQDINKVGAFRLLTSRNPNLVQGAIERYWGGVKTFTTWRENGLRLAAYRRAFKRLSAGERLYWASPRDEMDALYDAVTKGTRTLEDVAAKLAREAIGDYGDVSVAGQYLRSHLAPFWSWQEINAPRYVRLLKNLAHERTAGGEKPGRGAAARAAAVAGKRGAMWMAGRWFRLAILTNLLFAMVYLWNRTMFPEDDKLLNRNRDKLSLILGHRVDGSIRYIRFEGALSDALDWLNLGNWPHEVEGLAAGRKTWKDIAADAIKGPAERIVSAWEPFSKTVFELALGRRVGMKTFESGTSFQPRGTPIRDRAQHVARVFSVAQLYDLVTGKPKRRGVGENIVDAFLTYGTDPGEAAYYLIRDQAGRWNDAHGKESAGGGDPTNRQNALYYYKKALQWGDEKAAKKWLAEYKERGGTGPGMMSSIRLSAPMGTVPKSQRLAFLSSLGPEDKETLRIANEWYERWAAGRPR